LLLLLLLLLSGVRGADFVCFYDWEEGRLVRRIDVGVVREVIWSDNGELVAIAGDASFYILQVCVRVRHALLHSCSETAGWLTTHIEWGAAMGCAAHQRGDVLQERFCILLGAAAVLMLTDWV
jgi:hypothetical protein